ncbi:C4-dicarboxylate ABC transporter substrate-binding protein [Hahella sp. CCB-MM4]|uniref:TAXI family TRAP transporter solute-binding subunit n=1 Tax=Hahella sp. (strain CCB-MM4) TaxID=1926491 RepID=UPI000B9C322E|nr:TAXI family TRAP transporter solute-binding subunit [Hahella sp. CCB-MM4]OZG74986.1 C4-dicarboxylate ABC transporter substrate-binding protein [Hahella sp. CCB-MM4]
MLSLPKNAFCSRILAAAISVGTLLGYTANSNAEDKDYILATASTGGTYYPVGVAIATLSKIKLQPSNGISLSAINSAGSGENIKLMRENEAQFAILQGLFGKYAWEGTAMFSADGQQRNFRSVTMLWQNVEHFVLQNDYVSSGTITDMAKAKGQRVAMGKKNSGTIESNRTILNHFGLDIDKDYELLYAGYGPSSQALQDGKVVGFGTPAGVPVSAVINAFAQRSDITLLSFTDEQVKQADGNFDLWTPYTVKAGTYPGVDKDIQTIAQPNFLAVRNDIDEETVYLLTKTIYENLPFLNSIHKATTAMALDKAIAGLPVPLHPGAVRYYKEQGINIPARLISN